jgi:hypothetical protein
MLEGKTSGSIIASVHEKNPDPVYYHLHTHPTDPTPGTSWLEALANASGDDSIVSLFDGVKKVIPKPILAVLPPRHSYVTVFYLALRRVCEFETFLYTLPTWTSGDVESKHVSYFDLLKHLGEVLCNDLIHHIEHDHGPLVRSATSGSFATPPEPFLNVARLYISSLRNLLDLYAKRLAEGVITPKPQRRFENSKPQEQAFLGILNVKLEDGVGKARKAVFSHSYAGVSGMEVCELGGSSGPSGGTALRLTPVSTPMLSPQAVAALASSSTSTSFASSVPAIFAWSAWSASTLTLTPPATFTESSAYAHAAASHTTSIIASTSTTNTTSAVASSPSHMQVARDLTTDERRLFLSYYPLKLLELASSPGLEVDQNIILDPTTTPNLSFDDLNFDFHLMVDVNTNVRHDLSVDGSIANSFNSFVPSSQPRPRALVRGRSSDAGPDPCTAFHACYAHVPASNKRGRHEVCDRGRSERQWDPILSKL